MNERTACGKYEWIELKEGDKWQIGDFLLGSAGKPLYGKFTAKYIQEELGYEPVLEPGTLRGHTKYWIIRPIKYEENEFGEVSP